MAKILIVSDSPAIQSGLGRVTRELADRMAADGVDVAVAGWFDIHADINQAFDYPVYPATKMLEQSLGPLLEGFQPDVVLAIGDPWDFQWLSAKRAEGTPWRLAGYLNIEGRPLPLQCERILDGFDVLVTTSEFGARVVDRLGVHAVHHGVDPTVFRSIDVRRGAFEGRKLDETFLVLLNGQNHARKNFPTAIRGFAKFAQDKGDVLLYVNTKAAPGPDDSPGPNLLQTVVNLGLETPPIAFNPENQGPLNTIPDAKLNQIYNMATVLLVTSLAEGFCLPVLEAQAVGVVPIAPDDYSMTELVESRGYLYPVAARIENEVGMNVALVSEAGVAAALERAYQDWKFEREAWNVRRTRCQAFARLLTWNATYRGIKEALETPVLERVAVGRAISPQLRINGRAVARRHPEAFGVLKLGGLGDLLQTTSWWRRGQEAAPCRRLTNQPAQSSKGCPRSPKSRSPQPRRPWRAFADSFRTFYDLR
jgi:glycosyltransferase involved in cell wall biosynthesis